MPARRPLDEYRRKRDFESTPEPAPREFAPGEGPLRFMVHKHSATNLHYDLRLELDGVLVSWAVPKGPSAEIGQKRLAVHVEDHPLEYGGFEGMIPKGEYGGGPSLIWDSGTFSPDEGGATYFDDRDAAQREFRAGIEAGKVSVLLRGKKLKGSWALVHTKPATKEWLLLKHRDDAAQAGFDILDDGRSVASGVTIEELRERGGDNHYRNAGSPVGVPGVVAAKLAVVEPMLALAAPVPIRHEGWSFEPKLDGIRAVASTDHGRASLRSRGKRDISAQYPALVATLARLPVATALLDGEIVAIDERARPSFERLQRRMNLQDAGQILVADQEVPVVYFAFDLLHLDGYDLTGAALTERREMLSRVIIPSSQLSQVITIDAAPEEAFRAAIDAGFEGIIAKRGSSHYEPGRRNGAWLKRKGTSEGTFLVGGFTRGTGSRGSSFGGLLLGQPEADGTLTYRGRVGSGFTSKDIDRVMAALKPLAERTSPFAAAVPDAKEASWVRPELKVTVEYTEMTSAGVLRAPVFKGFTGDAVGQVRSAPPASAPEAAVEPDGQLLDQLATKAQAVRLEGDGWTLPLTNLEKALWPAAAERPAVTKRDLLRYAVLAAHLILPHLRDRPLTLLRFPNGISGKKFYQRHWDAERPSFIETVTVFADGERKDRDFLLCNNLPTLLWLCQLADIEWHASLARVNPAPDGKGLTTTFSGSMASFDASALNHPDFLLFDLDPYIFAGTEAKGAEPEPSRASFAKTCEVAFALKELLDSIGLTSFVKTSGATGIHVYVPVLRTLDYGVIRAAATTIFGELASRRPKDVTVEWVSGKRTGKVFLDANQNARQKSLAAPYSPRAKPGAPASIPHRWADLGKTYPGDISILEPSWITRPDPWAGILEAKNDLDRVLGL